MRKVLTPSCVELGEDVPHGGHSLVLFDSQDSFVYNIVDAFLGLGVRRVAVFDVTSFSVAQELIDCMKEQQASHCVVGPGPGSPSDSPHVVEAIRLMEGVYPLLGICLGHQMIVEAYGGRVGPSGAPCHGMASFIRISQESVLFRSVPPSFQVGRYHSLVARVVEPPLMVTSYLQESQASERPIVMAVEHRTAPTFGVQFHPESFLSAIEGCTILRNFLQIF